MFTNREIAAIAYLCRVGGHDNLLEKVQRIAAHNKGREPDDVAHDPDEDSDTPCCRVCGNECPFCV